MSNWKSIEKESNLTTALVVLCQDYVVVDEEFMSNSKIKKNLNNADFWIELANTLRGTVSSYLHNKNEVDDEGYDEYEANEVSDGVLMDFIMNPANRFELNDIICETVESWLKHFGKRKSK